MTMVMVTMVTGDDDNGDDDYDDDDNSDDEDIIGYADDSDCDNVNAYNYKASSSSYQ